MGAAKTREISQTPDLKVFALLALLWTSAAIAVFTWEYNHSIHHSLGILVAWLVGLALLLYSLQLVRFSSQALLESEYRYRQQFEQSRAVMLIVDSESGAIIDANPAACCYYGYDKADIRKLPISAINVMPADELAGCIAGVLDGSKRQFFARHRLATGELRDVEVFSNPIDHKGKVLLHSIVVDVTARLLAERHLLDKMDFTERLLRNSTAPTFVLDADHRVLLWNRALEELTGVKAADMIGSDRHWSVFYDSPRPCLADVVLDGGAAAAGHLYPHLSRSRLIPAGYHAEGDYTFASRRCRLVFSAAPIIGSDGSVIAVIQTLEDITERISLEAQLFQAQKMESVGELTGGIAHDFNNVLTIISGYVDLLKMNLPDDEECLAIAREISASVDRAADMTRSLLAFSGKYEVMLQHDDLDQILAAIHKSLRRLIREDLSLTVDSSEERLPVYVDRVQIEQLLINLVINARDALESNGVITISTRSVHFETVFTEGTTRVPPGRYACLAVADNGIGMEPVILERIFEPFFTTKKKGKGSGLGLAIVHGIVSKHCGFLSVITAPGKGTAFHIYLPLHEGEYSPEYPAAPRQHDYHGTETVLVVEDDAGIMKLLQEVLTRYGYTILTASDGVAALEVFHEQMDAVNIAVIDVIMPKMNGREVVEEIRRHRPELPIIMTSGYTEDILDGYRIKELATVFLHKPVKPQELLAAIRSSLDNPVPDSQPI